MRNIAFIFIDTIQKVPTNETEPVTEPTQERAANSNAQMINPKNLTNETVTELLFNSDDDDSPVVLQKEKRNRPKRQTGKKFTLRF